MTQTTKSAHDMTVAELQAEIGRLQSILHWKVAGDPRVAVQGCSLPITGPEWKLSDEAARDIEEIESHAYRG
jgi:hypothetical protein